MKADIHPSYQDILFVDTSTGFKFVCGSTLQPDETETFEGKEYPVQRVSVSSSSHPFFTGSTQFVDTEGRVDKFLKRYAKQEEKSKEEQQRQEESEAKKAEEKKKKPRKKKWRTK